MDETMIDKSAPTLWDYGKCSVLPITGCPWKGRLEEFYRHVINTHNDDITVVEMDNDFKTFIWHDFQTLRHQDGADFRLFIKAYNQLFFFKGEVRDGRTFFQMNFFGQPMDWKLYHFVFVAENPDQLDVNKITATAKCCWEPEWNVKFDPKRAAVVNNTNLRHVCIGNDLVFRLKIWGR